MGEMRTYRDGTGREVRLSDERLRHMLRRHPEMARHLPKIGPTLGEPYAIRTSRTDGTVRLYYRRYGGLPQQALYMCLVVKRRRAYSVILTGYLSRAIRGG